MARAKRTRNTPGGLTGYEHQWLTGEPHPDANVFGLLVLEHPRGRDEIEHCLSLLEQYPKYAGRHDVADLKRRLAECIETEKRKAK